MGVSASARKISGFWKNVSAYSLKVQVILKKCFDCHYFRSQKTRRSEQFSFSHIFPPFTTGVICPSCYVILYCGEKKGITRLFDISIGRHRWSVKSRLLRYRYRGKIVYRFHGYHIKNCMDYIATVTEAYKKYTSYFVILVTVNNIVALRYCKGTKSVRY